MALHGTHRDRLHVAFELSGPGAESIDERPGLDPVHIGPHRDNPPVRNLQGAQRGVLADFDATAERQQPQRFHETPVVDAVVVWKKGGGPGIRVRGCFKTGDARARHHLRAQPEPSLGFSEGYELRLLFLGKSERENAVTMMLDRDAGESKQFLGEVQMPVARFESQREKRRVGPRLGLG